MAELIYAGDGGAFKVCSKCNFAVPTHGFARGRGLLGRYSVCRACNSIVRSSRRLENVDEERRKGREKYANNPEYFRRHARDWRARNHEYCLVKEAEYRDRNRELLREKDRIRIAADRDAHNLKTREQYIKNPGVFISATRRWQENNPEKVKEYARRRRSTPQGRLENNIRGAVHRGLVTGTKRRRRTFDILGYAIEELREHLERQFQPGMSWDNYGEWHVDHIRPLSAYNYESPDDPEFKAAWALTNLRPLWAVDNISKGAKILTLV